MKEQDFQALLWANPHLIEEGLTPVGKEVGTGSGPADLVFKDARGNTLIVELKVNGTSKAEPQVNRYAAAYILKHGLEPAKIRKMVVAHEIDDKLRMACKLANAECKEIQTIDIATLKPIEKEKKIFIEVEKIVEKVVERRPTTRDLRWRNPRIKFSSTIKRSAADNINEDFKQHYLPEPVVFAYGNPENKTTIEISNAFANTMLNTYSFPLLLKLFEKQTNPQDSFLTSLLGQTKVTEFHSEVYLPEDKTNSYFDLTITGKNITGNFTHAVTLAFESWINTDRKPGTWYLYENRVLTRANTHYPPHRPSPEQIKLIRQKL